MEAPAVDKKGIKNFGLRINSIIYLSYNGELTSRQDGSPKGRSGLAVWCSDWLNANVDYPCFESHHFESRVNSDLRFILIPINPGLTSIRSCS